MRIIFSKELATYATLVQSVRVSQPRRLLLQMHVGFIKLKVAIFELLYLKSLAVILLDFVHQLCL